jgi:hypothetical protein
MHEDLEPLANLKIGKAMEESSREMQEQLSKKIAELNARGLARSGMMMAAKFDIRAAAMERRLRSIADTWTELITRSKGSLSREDVTFIMSKVQAAAGASTQSLAAASVPEPGGPTTPSNWVHQQAAFRTGAAAAKINRDLEISLREQQAFPKLKEAPQMPPTTHINIQNSTISNLNFGEQVGTINTALDILSAGNAGNDRQALADAIKQLTEAVVNDPTLPEANKREAVDALSTLAKEATDWKGKATTTAKAMISYLPGVINTSASLLVLWDKFGATVRTFFGA